MITKSDIKLICNYTENKKITGPVGIINYLEGIKDNDEYTRIMKMKVRDHKIDVVLDNVKEENDEIVNVNFEELNEGSISIKFISQNVTATSYNNLNDLYDSIIKKIENLTSSPMIVNFQADVIITNDHSMSINSRRILARILMLSNKIACDSYLGPAKSVIVGKNVAKYIYADSMLNKSTNNSTSIGSISGLSIIYSDIINPNKVIVLRSSDRTETGLNVINNINCSNYFMSETINTWDRCFAWFNII